MQSGGTGQHVQAAASCAVSPFGYFHMDILEKHKYFCTTPIYQLSKSFKNDLDIYEVIGFFANNH